MIDSDIQFGSVNFISAIYFSYEPPIRVHLVHFNSKIFWTPNVNDNNEKYYQLYNNDSMSKYRFNNNNTVYVNSLVIGNFCNSPLLECI